MRDIDESKDFILIDGFFWPERGGNESQQNVRIIVTSWCNNWEFFIEIWINVRHKKEIWIWNVAKCDIKRISQQNIRCERPQSIRRSTSCADRLANQKAIELHHLLILRLCLPTKKDARNFFESECIYRTFLQICECLQENMSTCRFLFVAWKCRCPCWATGEPSIGSALDA